MAVSLPLIIIGVGLGIIQLVLCGVLAYNWKKSPSKAKKKPAKPTHRSKLLEHVAQDMHTVCLCIPLRLSVFLHAIIGVFICALLLALPDRSRSYFGGYDHLSRVFLAINELGGVFFGFAGAVGAYRQEARGVNAFFWYQVVRLFLWLGILAVDGPALWQCERWVMDVEGMSKAHGWNPLMYEVALNLKCPSARFDFFASSLVYLLLLVWLAMATQSYAQDLEREPKYLLHLQKNWENQGNACYQTKSVKARVHADIENDPNGLKEAGYEYHGTTVPAGYPVYMKSPSAIYRHTYWERTALKKSHLVRVEDDEGHPGAHQHGASTHLAHGLEKDFMMFDGGIPEGGDMGPTQHMTVAKAMEVCANTPGCRGFTFPGEDTGGEVAVTFKNHWAAKVGGWTSYKYNGRGPTEEIGLPSVSLNTDQPLLRAALHHQDL